MRAATAGVLYLLTFALSIPTLTLYEPLRDHADFVLGAGDAGTVTLGAVLEVFLAIACVGTAVALVPVMRRYHESAGLGYLAARVVEGALILVGVISVLTVLTLRREGGGTAEAGSLLTAGRVLTEVYDGTFLLGQSLMPVLNALCLGWVLYRTGLVPRLIPLLGLVGAPLLLASDIAVLCDAYGQRSSVAALAALPIAAWELTLGVWLIVKGFREPSGAQGSLSSPSTRSMTRNR
ncbi:hypothetical protein Ade02nite_57450 [Paractinoplanes deccanensis]|uniref:DUF4386 domain-containing protein n=1 Tax=Paractinoplanes deccanensis TaxID=113561 RepID=A0ABQ3YAS3_9ACTN|nr:DUF4386 domain-containing protein [Actinoplanes deccanensis]GID77104.1 hypothetical protein Ade02nite_57450 [Actinoplanes deccanensis]